MVDPGRDRGCLSEISAEDHRAVPARGDAANNLLRFFPRLPSLLPSSTRINSQGKSILVRGFFNSSVQKIKAFLFVIDWNNDGYFHHTLPDLYYSMKKAHNMRCFSMLFRSLYIVTKLKSFEMDSICALFFSSFVQDEIRSNMIPPPMITAPMISSSRTIGQKIHAFENAVIAAQIPLNEETDINDFQQQQAP